MGSSIPIIVERSETRLYVDMKLDKSHITSGIVGAVMGACSVVGINALSGHSNSEISSFFDTASHKAKTRMYERVEADAEGDVFITTKGKKYHREGCYVLRQSDETKRASRSNVIDVGYEPCRKCRP